MLVEYAEAPVWSVCLVLQMAASMELVQCYGMQQALNNKGPLWSESEDHLRMKDTGVSPLCTASECGHFASRASDPRIQQFGSDNAKSSETCSELTDTSLNTKQD
jgi:hypothetical protein